MAEKLLRQNGDYKNLICYQKANAIFEITGFFAPRFFNKIKDRTVDQMVQAARSGKQNIAEGCSRHLTSAKTELKLLDVARASLFELLEDYEDYLRVNGQRQWEKGSREFEYMQELGRAENSAEFYMPFIKVRPPETIANMAIILIRQAAFLILRLMEKLAKEFEEEGGFSERMTRIRKDRRGY